MEKQNVITIRVKVIKITKSLGVRFNKTPCPTVDKFLYKPKYRQYKPTDEKILILSTDSCIYKSLNITKVRL